MSTTNQHLRRAARAVVANTLIAAMAMGLASVHARELPPRILSELSSRFKAADKNKDGSIDREEARDGMPMVFRNFDKIDLQASGKVSLTDVETFVAGMRRRRPGGLP